MLATAKAGIREITTAEAEAEMTAPGTIVLDVRELAEEVVREARGDCAGA